MSYIFRTFLIPWDVEIAPLVPKLKCFHKCILQLRWPIVLTLNIVFLRTNYANINLLTKLINSILYQIKISISTIWLDFWLANIGTNNRSNQYLGYWPTLLCRASCAIRLFPLCIIQHNPFVLMLILHNTTWSNYSDIASTDCDMIQLFD